MRKALSAEVLGTHGHWIAGAIRHKGALRRELHVKAGEKIPSKTLARAAKSRNPTLRKRAVLDQTLKRMRGR